MKVIVKARHTSLTPALKKHAEEKLGKAIMKIFDRPAAKIEIELTDLGAVKADNKECRATVSMPKGKSITISEVSEDMYSAINLCHDRLLTQVKRERGKRQNTTKVRKEAAKNRERQAANTLTADAEPWEAEVAEYERSQSHG